MRSIIFSLFIIIFWSCSSTNQNEEYTKAFNDIFGVENTKIIDEIVYYGDSILMSSYKTKDTYNAYFDFLIDIRDNNLFNFELNIDKRLKKDFLQLFEKNDIKNQIFHYSERDGKECFSIYFLGKFYKVSESLKDSDSIAKEFYDSYSHAGSPSYPLIAQGILEDSVIDNYLVKRYVIFDMLYRKIHYST